MVTRKQIQAYAESRLFHLEQGRDKLKDFPYTTPKVEEYDARIKEVQIFLDLLTIRRSKRKQTVVE